MNRGRHRKGTAARRGKDGPSESRAESGRLAVGRRLRLTCWPVKQELTGSEDPPLDVADFCLRIMARSIG